jgi:hypothetical protein
LTGLALSVDLLDTLKEAKSGGVFDFLKLSSGDQKFAEIFFYKNGMIRSYSERSALAEALGKIDPFDLAGEDRTPFNELIERVRHNLMSSPSIASRRLGTEMSRIRRAI